MAQARIFDPENQDVIRRSLRAVAAVWLLALLGVGLAGCDSPLATPEPPAATEEPEATVAPEPTEAYPPGVTPLVFWEPFPLDRPQGLLLGEMIRDFEAENPDIVVEIVPKSGYIGIDGAMQAGLEGGELPNLTVAFPSMIAQYAESGVVAPLDAFVYDLEYGLSEEDLADIYPGHLEASRLPGAGRQMLTFPFVQNAIGMWVNKTLLAQAGWERAPTTWAEFEQACLDVVASTGVGCYAFVESVSTFDAWLLSRGGQQIDESGQRAAFNGPAGVESLALVRRLMDSGLAWHPEDTYGDYVAFANGQAAFTFSSTGNSLLYVDAYEAALAHDVPPFEWRQTMVPQADPENPATVLYGASFFVLEGDPEQKLAAWRLIRWFTDTRQTARWASGLQTMPVRASALTVMTDTLEAYPFVQVQAERIMPYGRPEPANSAALKVRDILHTAIISATLGYLDPQTALDQAAQDANRALSGDQ